VGIGIIRKCGPVCFDNSRESIYFLPRSGSMVVSATTLYRSERSVQDSMQRDRR